MGLDPQSLSLLLGPGGTLVLSLVIVMALVREIVVPKGRLDDMRAQRDQALALLDRSVSGSAGMASAIEERNRLDAARLEAANASHGLSRSLAETESRIARRR